MTVALEIVVGAVGRQYHGVVITQCDEGARSYSRHLLVATELTFGLLFYVLSEKVVVRTLVGETRIHRDYWIEKDLEVGSCLASRSRSYGRCKMSASRRPHDTNVVGINLPRRCIAAQHLYSLLGVFHRHLPTAVGHTVFQHHHRNSHIIKERCPLVSLVIHCEM